MDENCSKAERQPSEAVSPGVEVSGVGGTLEGVGEVEVGGATEDELDAL